MILDPNLKYQVQMWQAVFCLLYWVVLFFIYVPQIKAPSNKGIGYFGFFILSTTYAVFSFTTGDFFHYEILYDRMLVSKTVLHIEQVYKWFVFNSFDNYYVWRLFVWGGALACLIYTCKVLRLNAKFACFIYVLVLLYYAIEMRQSLAFGMLYLGWAFLLRQNKNKGTDYILGLLLIVFSFFFHKSMYMYILLSVAVYLTVFGGKILYVGSLILFPFLYSFLFLIVDKILFMSSQFESFIAVTNRYMEKDLLILNIGGYIQLAFQRFGLLLLMFYSVKKIYFKKELAYKYEKFFLNLSYVFFYISFLCFMQPFFGAVSQRFWDASYFTMAIFLASFLYRQKRTRFFKLSVYSLSFITLYELLLVLYRLL